MEVNFSVSCGLLNILTPFPFQTARKGAYLTRPSDRKLMLTMFLYLVSY